MKNKKLIFIVSLLSICIGLSIPTQVLADDTVHETSGTVEFYYSDSSSVVPPIKEKPQDPIEKPVPPIKEPNLNKLPQTGEEKLALYFKIGVLSAIVGLLVLYKTKKKIKCSDFQ
ncbi:MULTISPECIES: LPXTG cell wall anchor domain-containing protein [Carnobacterium]|uniref:Gram-positive cocci surface proteins LPxTG domain-containing protein n=1 Tax=Carnobacterium divergens TaxID=2748 RepID=A0A5F0N351_CARDV|nr:MULTISPECIES: LPXTG cell wall anchor domain-containing protein [Carnobacterium]MDT1940169.1 LPXTG cell wall anchor domain-containing protein [Carnobacterium divergens]MDT1942607.1 LPXTG cell wall anchor domain-containing protein [Carnobacterium divergens]MDT1948413.1 LPXTG cell wall anchor domain-containing protein [Carnobacterium divergens]MDT1950893.1 LPXTG cell wall anchor domain-containing protein [Carnobacterium divergens]MDT1955723.1 LPXTG cell wall anchor domain-containing protein [C